PVCKFYVALHAATCTTDNGLLHLSMSFTAAGGSSSLACCNSLSMPRPSTLRSNTSHIRQVSTIVRVIMGQDAEAPAGRPHEVGMVPPHLEVVNRVHLPRGPASLHRQPHPALPEHRV